MSTRSAPASEYERIVGASGDPFLTLEVDIEASDAEVKSAYKQLAMKFHPDRLRFEPGTSDRERADRKAKATEAFKLVSTAFYNLSSPSLRDDFAYKAMRSGSHYQVQQAAKARSAAAAAAAVPKKSAASPTTVAVRSTSYSHGPGSVTRESLYPTAQNKVSLSSKASPSNTSPKRRGSLAATVSAPQLHQNDLVVRPERQQNLEPAVRRTNAPSPSTALVQDPFRMFDAIFSTGRGFDDNPAGMLGQSGDSGSTMMAMPNPFDMFNQLMGTDNSASDFLQANSSPRSADPFAMQPQPQQRQRPGGQNSVMNMGGGGAADSFESMFNQLSMGIGGMDQSEQSPSMRGGMVTERTSGGYTDAYGNIKLGRTDHSRGVWDMGLNGKMFMESKKTVQTFTSGGGMTSEPMNYGYSSQPQQQQQSYAYETPPRQPTYGGALPGSTSRSNFGPPQPQNPFGYRPSAAGPSPSVRGNTFRMNMPFNTPMRGATF